MHMYHFHWHIVHLCTCVHPMMAIHTLLQTSQLQSSHNRETQPSWKISHLFHASGAHVHEGFKTPNLFGNAHTPLLKCIGVCLQLTIYYVLQLIHYAILCVCSLLAHLWCYVFVVRVSSIDFGRQDSLHLILILLSTLMNPLPGSSI